MGDVGSAVCGSLLEGRFLLFPADGRWYPSLWKREEIGNNLDVALILFLPLFI